MVVRYVELSRGFMGYGRQELMESRDRIQLAADYLMTQGHLSKCEKHGEYHGGSVGLDDGVYEGALADRALGDGGPIAWAAKMEPEALGELLVSDWKLG